MMRLDKYLADLNIGSRSQVKEYIKKGLITVNQKIIKDNNIKINEKADIVTYLGERLTYEKYRYYMLHKPQGVITATKDKCERTVLDLLVGINIKELSPVGRLDKDTEGLLLITNDGELSHALLSPKKHVNKTYRVICKESILKEQIVQLENGIDIGDEKPCLPAMVEQINSKEILLTIQEGRFHQVKRMLQAVGNEVIYLKRERFGSLKLDETLKSGEFRPLTEEEIAQLRKDI